MTKRILLALTLAASLGGAVIACNSPSGTTSPGGSAGGGLSSPAASVGAGGEESPAGSDMTEPSLDTGSPAAS
jgi:hypothetical protein